MNTSHFVAAASRMASQIGGELEFDPEFNKRQPNFFSYARRNTTMPVLHVRRPGIDIRLFYPNDSLHYDIEILDPRGEDLADAIIDAFEQRTGLQQEIESDFALKCKEKGSVALGNYRHATKHPGGTRRITGEFAINGFETRLEQELEIGLQRIASILTPKTSSDIYDRFLDAGFPEYLAEKVVPSVDAEISRLEVLTTSTMSGISGGGVGRVEFENERTPYVFKIQANKRAAYKDAVIPATIHDRASTDLLAAQLARRIPKPLFSEPVQVGDYYVTLAQDVADKVVVANKVDLSVITPQINKGLRYDVVEKLYTAALFHEAMRDVKIDDMVTDLTLPLNYELQLIESRFGSKLASVTGLLNRARSKYEAWREDLAQERDDRLRVQSLGDNKPDNYEGAASVGKSFVDFGLSSQAYETQDIARVLMGEVEICQNTSLMGQYVDAFVEMRQQIQHIFRKSQITYTPNKVDLKREVRMQTGIDALRSAAWRAYTNAPQKEFERYVACSQAIFSLD